MVDSEQIDMIAPSDLEEGKIIQTFAGSGVFEVFVPKNVKKGERFSAIVVRAQPGTKIGASIPSAPTEDAANIFLNAVPVQPDSTWTQPIVVSSITSQQPMTAGKSDDGAKKTSGLAISAMVCGIVGLFFFGIILGPIAIVFGAVAKNKISKDPNLQGGCQANAGLVLGIIDVALWAVILILVLSS